MKTRKSNFRLLLILAIIVLINIIADRYFFRLDFTEDKRYTLSKATEDILDELDETVTVTAYFTEDLPQEFMRLKRDFKELLIEFGSASGKNVVYEFVDPAFDPRMEQKVIQEGIRPLLINARSKDELKQQKVYLGALVQYGERSEAIPYIERGAAMEYGLASAIKKLSVIDKPMIAFVIDHGQPRLDFYPQAMESLKILYDVRSISLYDSIIDLRPYRAIVINGPQDSVPPRHLKLLDEYLAQGGNIYLGLNTIGLNNQTQEAIGLPTGFDSWLMQKGILLNNSLVVDASCGQVQVPQQVGNMQFMTNISFPYFPRITKFEEHPITQGIEQVAFQFASPISFVGDTSLTFTPFLKTSEKSGSRSVPNFIDITKQWSAIDFPMSNLTIGAILSGNIAGNAKSNIVVITDADFPVNGQGQQARQIDPNSVALFVNAIDWLSDDTGLIELRTKGVTARPLEQVEDSTKTILKWLNFLIPIILIIIYSFIRGQRNRNRRIKRMEEGYV